MIKYAKIVDEITGLCDVGIGTNIDFYKSVGMTQMDVQQSDIDENWYLTVKCPMKTDEQKAQEEAQRIAMLSLTRGDVFRAVVKSKGVTKAEIKALIEAMPTTTDEEKLAKELALIDFEDSLNFYRGNPLIDTIGTALGYTKEELDYLFEHGEFANDL